MKCEEKYHKKGGVMKIKKKSIKYPSARLKGLAEFMTFVKEPDWKPATINIELFKRLGMAKGKESEAIYALKFLGIINENGVPSEEFDNLKHDYQGTIKKLVQEKYNELFNLVPMKLMNQSRLVNFFGAPVETAEYQTKLFVWFCNEAGIDLPSMESRIHRARYDKNKKH
jgi:hypothetical protein